MKIFIGSDHRGYTLKERIKTFLAKQSIQFTDVGAYSKKISDYPDYADRVAKQVGHKRQGTRAVGILICASGVGMEIAANKVRGVRAVNAWNTAIARSSRKDDDTNVLCLDSEDLTVAQAKRIIHAWLATPFSRKKRYIRRVKKISRLER